VAFRLLHARLAGKRGTTTMMKLDPLRNMAGGAALPETQEDDTKPYEAFCLSRLPTDCSL
jgi:hypothetical protein